jgi:endonuclease V-like protein UPF0215 family
VGENAPGGGGYQSNYHLFDPQNHYLFGGLVMKTVSVNTDLLRKQIEFLDGLEQTDIVYGLVNYLEHRLDIIEGVKPEVKEVPA